MDVFFELPSILFILFLERSGIFHVYSVKMVQTCDNLNTLKHFEKNYQE